MSGFCHRHRFILRAALASWLVLAGCESAPLPRRVGILLLSTAHEPAQSALQASLAQRNVLFFVRQAESRGERLDALARELVAERLDLLVAFSTPAAIAAKDATEVAKTPLVFSLVSDPLGAGLVSNLPRPGGRVTGIVDAGAIGAGKRLEHLVKAFPGTRRVLVVRSHDPTSVAELEALDRAAKKLDVTLVLHTIASVSEARRAFESVEPGSVDAVYVPPDSIAASARDELAALIRRDHLPGIRGGGADPATIMSFGVDISDVGRQTAALAAKVLDGLAPGDLPVEPPHRVRLTLYPRRAEDLGLVFPETTLSRADDVNLRRD